MKKNRVLQPSDHPVTWYPLGGKYLPENDANRRVNVMAEDGRVWWVYAAHFLRRYDESLHGGIHDAAWWSYPLEVRHEQEV